MTKTFLYKKIANGRGFACEYTFSFDKECSDDLFPIVLNTNTWATKYVNKAFQTQKAKIEKGIMHLDQSAALTIVIEEVKFPMVDFKEDWFIDGIIELYKNNYTAQH